MSSVPRSIVGVVRDADGRPVARARVYFVSGPVPLQDVAALTGADGSFALTAPQPGVYEVGSNSDEHGSASARVTVGKGDAKLDFKLPA